jgi:hypothetical protein
VKVMNSVFRSIKISITVFRVPTYRRIVIDATFRTMLVDDKLRPVQ